MKINSRISVTQLWLILAACALLVTLAMRLPSFGHLPSGLNRDEAALGYSAYSLLKTGADEWGHRWPVSITSFGDQKLPGYVYTLIPFIALFDLTTATVRLPSFIAGLVTVIAGGVIALQLAHSIPWSPKLRVAASFFTMLLIAISPWGMHFSRVAYEAHLAMAFFLTGLCCYWHSVELVHKSRQRVWLLVTAILWSATLLTYHSYHIFLPLFLITVALIDWQKIKKFDLFGLVCAISIGLLTIGLLVSGGVLQANKVKNTGISPLHTVHLLNQATLFRQASELPSLVEKLVFNKYGEGLVKLTQNYLTSFSGTFFFVHGSNHGDHNPGNANNSNLLVAPFLAIGLIGLRQWKQHTKIRTVYAWLFLGLLPASLTISPLHEIRMSTVFPVMELLASMGIIFILSKIPRTLSILAVTGILLLLSLASFRTFLQYIYISPNTSVRTTHFHVLAAALARYQSQNLPLVTQSPSSSPYIWYLFENKIDPNWLQENRVTYKPTSEGFIHIKSIGPISFEVINWDDIAERSKIQSQILFLRPTEISDTLRTTEHWQLLEVLYDENEVVYEVWKVLKL